MKFETTFLRSRVARRIFILFICCALLPIGALAILSFTQVEKQLNDLDQKRLHHSNKAVGMAIFERLLFLRDEMKTLASKYGTKSNHAFPPPDAEFIETLNKRFKGLVIITGNGKRISLFGHIRRVPELTPEQSHLIRSGGALLSSERFPGLDSEIFVTMALDSKNQGSGMLVGQLNPAYLWNTIMENPLPMTELCILDQSNHVVFSSLPEPVSFPERATLQMRRSALGQFEWVHQRKKYIASYWSIFLQSAFSTPKWTVVLSKSRSDMLAPMANFKKIFLPVLLLSLWVVLLLSIVQIRRSLIPLEKLQEGTRRIAAQDFNIPVTIKSGDEFEELAASFNTMAKQLGKQFNILTAVSEIDRAILSALDTEKIIDVVLARIPGIFPCDNVGMTSLDYNDRIIGRTHIRSGKGDKKEVVEAIDFSAKEIQELMSHPERLLIELDEVAPSYLAPMVRNGIRTFLVLPIVLKKRLSGFITLGWSSKSTTPTQEDFDRVRQLADQTGVALTNANLIRELNEFNWGTLGALARAIDAKSPWTAGHSERVTKLGLKIGRLLGLPQEQMDVLHRAGLLHDIGKLGVPRDILDKEGKLTTEEERLMREHVRLGLRILEPIAAYNEVVPIVLQHHECFNGKGYPDGLAGQAISLGGRIFAVADSFDALTSNRPYRNALSREHAIEIIKQGCGNRYDPEIVQAFLGVMVQESKELEA